MTETTSLKKLQELQAQIAQLREDAAEELRDRRSSLLKELQTIDAELAELTGKTVQDGEKKRRSRGSAGAGKSLPLDELKELLANAPDKTLSIRKEGLDLASIKTLAAANPQLLKMGGKGPWPTVMLGK